VGLAAHRRQSRAQASCTSLALPRSAPRSLQRRTSSSCARRRRPRHRQQRASSPSLELHPLHCPPLIGGLEGSVGGVAEQTGCHRISCWPLSAALTWHSVREQICEARSLHRSCVCELPRCPSMTWLSSTTARPPRQAGRATAPGWGPAQQAKGTVASCLRRASRGKSRKTGSRCKISSRERNSMQNVFHVFNQMGNSK